MPDRCKLSPALPALLALLLSASCAGPASALQPNQPTPAPDLSFLGLNIRQTGSCGLEFAGVARTDSGGGADTFEILVTDEGVPVGSQGLSLPADGRSHQFHFILTFAHLFVDDDYGLTIEDPGGIGTVILDEEFQITGCSILTVPTLSPSGAGTFGLLLLSAAVLVLYRRRARA